MKVDGLIPDPCNADVKVSLSKIPDHLSGSAVRITALPQNVSSVFSPVVSCG